MNFYEIPLSPQPQNFAVVLASVPYACRLYWNTADEVWCIDLLREDDSPLVTALPLVTGVDLLGQFRHLGIGGSLVVQVDGNPYLLPTYQNLGTGSRLIFVTE